MALTAPSEGTSFQNGDSFTVTANAEDSDGNVTQVNFFYDNKWLGVDTTAPYLITRNSPPQAGANTQLTAVATDDDYASAISAPVAVNLPPAGC